MLIVAILVATHAAAFIGGAFAHKFLAKTATTVAADVAKKV